MGNNFVDNQLVFATSLAVHYRDFFLSVHRSYSRALAKIFTMFRNIRQFSALARTLAKDAGDIKKRLKKEQRRKVVQKQAPESHLLHMTVPSAMRYLRAAEVGMPAEKTTISLHMTVLPERGSKPLSGEIFLPRPMKDSHVMVFSANPEVVEKALSEGAAYAGGVDLIEKIQKGEIKLDGLTHAFATPDIVKELKAIARQVGPKGLMPLAKKGTVADDVFQLMKNSAGAMPFKQKGEHLAIPIGRADFSDHEILANLKAASDSIYGAQPPGTKKPNLIGKAVLSLTRGPGLVINVRNQV